METTRNIAVVGAGPMAVYTVKGLLTGDLPVDLTVFDATDQVGCGMPYRAGMNADYMYCNAFSREIPSVTRPLVSWLHDQDDGFLDAWDLGRADIDARDFYPRVLLGEYLKSEFSDLCDAGRKAGHTIRVLPGHRVVDVMPTGGGVALEVSTPDGKSVFAFDDVVLATGHDWPSSPKLGKADLVSPWPYTNITDQPAGDIGVLGSSLSAIDVVVALGQEHGTFTEENDKVSWFADTGREALSITMVSHKGIIPEPDFYYPFPYERLTHLHSDAVAAEVEKGPEALLTRVFGLLLAELNEVAPEYMAELGPDAQTIDGFSAAYFEHRETVGGLRALRETLGAAIKSKELKETQPERYALLRGHENFEMILEHMNDADWKTFNEKLMPVFGDCYAAIPHISVRRVLALYDAGVLQIIPTGSESSLRNNAAGGVTVSTVDGDIEFAALIDARGQASADISDLPFPTLVDALADPAADLSAPFRLDLSGAVQGSVYCLAMPQILTRHPFSQGLANCDELGRVVSKEILSSI
ncbi:FAD/NAD(P)-binding protein [Roseobacter sp. GAI101]|uniref:FAD/NAD(P)-binding protein n=1 Tax=Roseobacter sp. (strain GAI101) TaxID=391589 RepID=UPI000A00582F|nr:FAD/NAD(P)-binding protein [Roseobacter sp. GAI101]